MAAHHNFYRSYSYLNLSMCFLNGLEQESLPQTRCPTVPKTDGHSIDLLVCEVVLWLAQTYATQWMCCGA